MKNSNKRSLRSHPSVLPLRITLIAAEKESPSCPPCTDRNQQRALQLIAGMKTEYRKPLPFTSWKDDETLNSFRLQDVIGSHV
ncbi:MAG TPA: hypothetical protein VK851_14670 [Anaerolineales bacterium]|nr:hypothetical protein [Anaerolineales bacterium]